MNSDVLKEGLEAIPQWLAFLEARRREVEAEAQRMQATGSTPPPTTLSSLFGGRGQSGAPVVVPVGAEEAEGAALLPLAVTPESIPADGAAALPLLAVTPESVPADGAAAPTTPTELLEEATPAPPTSEASVAETESPPAAPTSANEALAQFERAWQRSAPELPKMVQDAYSRRAEAPVEFAQVMIGARESGYLSPEMERAVRDLIGFDMHFQNAEVLFQDPQFADLFEIVLEEVDYGAGESPTDSDAPHNTDTKPDALNEEDSPPEGEAERAANQGEAPF